ncbi:LuxR C-terminal-related transcriptional regulator [Solemya velesiana gill symbiont]|uniref:HTH luxR-type domain-containing protein n=1 Tax=Solemya velesiana gill symbiont TaxID=1918948 RepID=A0A1T2KSZ7_9GAMM|nr:response regulator transcription factor [Solemya velesiana gill symbiont]OOZ35979.1 hypothetical protein BOW51_09430 [Solemya velesiana gill symbiont]
MIIICTTDSVLQKRWQSALSGVYEISTASGVDELTEVINGRDSPIVFLNIRHGDMDNPEALKIIREQCPGARIIVFSNEPSTQEGMSMLKSGAYGYCNAYIAEQLLSKVVDTVSDGEVWVGWSLMQSLIKGIGGEVESKPTTGRFGALTHREWEIARLISQGESNKSIARKLDIAEHTTKNHISSIFRKTDLKDRLNLALEMQKILRH